MTATMEPDVEFFDDDYLDAEIIVDRAPCGRDGRFTTADIREWFGGSRALTHRDVARGLLEPPQEVGDVVSGHHSEWTREQMVRWVAARIRGGYDVPGMRGACGTYKGSRRHRRRHEPLCEPCRLAETAYRQAQRKGARVGKD